MSVPLSNVYLPLVWTSLTPDEIITTAQYVQSLLGIPTPLSGINEALVFLQRQVNQHCHVVFSSKFVQSQQQTQSLINAQVPQIGAQIEVTYSLDFPVTIRNLFTAEIYRLTVGVERGMEIDITLLMSESDEFIFNLGRHLGICKPGTPRPGDYTRQELLRREVIRVMRSLNLIIQKPFTNKRVKVWKYSFPSDYNPDKEDDILKRFKTVQMSLYEEIEYTKRTSQHILSELARVDQVFSDPSAPMDSKMRPVSGDLIEDVSTHRLYLIDQKRILSLLNLPPTFTFPQYEWDYWSSYGLYPWINLSKHEKELTKNLRGPINSAEFRQKAFLVISNEMKEDYEWRTYLVIGNNYAVFTIITQDENIDSVIAKIRTDSYVSVLSRPLYNDFLIQ